MKLFTKCLLLHFVLILSTSIGLAQEICDNGIDDDGDGLVDFNDTIDCTCLAAGIPSSLIPNPSFEEMNCCPNIYSQLNCATSWQQASVSTTDYMNTCGFVTAATISSGLVPFPDGEGIAGAIISPGYKEYIGTCLNSPMVTGVSYSIDFFVASSAITNIGGVCGNGTIYYGDINLTIFGHPSCGALPFPGAGADCPTGTGWVELGYVTYTPTNAWELVNITFTAPVDINAMVLGSPCVLSSDYTNFNGCFPYFYFDNLILNETNPTNLITLTFDGGTCADEGVLTATEEIAGGAWQWYFNGVAIIGETTNVLDMTSIGSGAGEYVVRYIINGECSQLSFVLPSIQGPDLDTTVVVSCESYLWPLNAQTYTQSGLFDVVYVNQYGCDSIITLELSINNGFSMQLDTTICIGEQLVFQGTNYSAAGNYSENYLSVNGCDSVFYLNLSLEPKPDSPSLSVVIPKCSQSDVILKVTEVVSNGVVNWSGPNNYVTTGNIATVNSTGGNSGIYYAFISVNGCSSELSNVDVDLSDLVIIGDEPIPNVFTPNSDGVNDEIDLRTYFMGCDFKLTIINRWGNLVFEQDSSTNGFTGLSFQGDPLAEGVYFYHLTFNGGEKSGFITITR